MQPEIISRQRQPLDLAISAGRQFQSAQTGFIHFCYKLFDDEEHDTIPIHENLLMALALLRTRVADTMNEGKEIVDRLLNFQHLASDENEGNFPLYLHEYPKCRDRYLAIHLLPASFWILKDYRKVLGQDLGQRFQRAVEGMVGHCLRVAGETLPSYTNALKLACSLKALGSLLEKKAWEEQGSKWLDELHTKGLVHSWFVPTELGDILISLQMVYPRLPLSPWKPLWDHLTMTWHKQTGTYMGPGLQERHKQCEPQSTLYDLFMNLYNEAISYRSFLVHPYQLQGALIHPIEDMLPDLTFPFSHASEFEGRKWMVYQTQKLGYSVIEQLTPENPSQEYRIHPLRMVWGDKNRVHTFVNQGGNAEKITFKFLSDKELQLKFHLLAQEIIPDRDNARDVSFFIDMHDSLKKTVAGKASTTFQLNEPIELNSDNFSMTVDFTKDGFTDNGHSQFFGHIMPGNRPAQMGLKGVNRFRSFDYQVFLRAVERKQPCTITASLKI